MKRVILAEDYSIVVKGMQITFETEFKGYQLDVVKNCPDLLRNLKQNTYQLAIIDLQLDDGSTLHMIRDILNLYPDLNILIFSANPEELYAEKLYKEGVKGYLNKQASDAELIMVIRRLLEGKSYMSEHFKEFMMSHNANPSANPFYTLTDREIDVLNLMLQGKRSIDICQELNLQATTVATYKMKILSKLKVKNILDLKELITELKMEFFLKRNAK